MNYVAGDIVKIRTLHPGFWALNGKTATVVNPSCIWATLSESGEAVRMVTVEVAGSTYDMFPAELVPWNGIDRLLSQLDDK